MRYNQRSTAAKPTDNKKAAPSYRAEKQSLPDKTVSEALPKKVRRERTIKATTAAGKKRHKKNYILNYILVLIFLIAVMVTLSVTVLFNAESIEVSFPNAVPETALLRSVTPSLPTQEEIVAASGLIIGDNLIKTSLSAAEDKLLAEYVAFDEVNVKRSFPNGLVIEVVPATEKANLYYNGSYYVISDKNRIIEVSSSRPSNGLVTFIGFGLDEPEQGDYLEAEGYPQIETLDAVNNAINENNIDSIRLADITDDMSIQLYYEQKYLIKAGGTYDITYRLYCAQSIIEQKLTDSDEKGIIDISVDNGTYYFRPSDNIEIPLY